MPPLQAAHEADLGEFAELLDGKRLATNLHRAYDEFHGGTHDALVDVDQLFAELVTARRHSGMPRLTRRRTTVLE